MTLDNLAFALIKQKPFTALYVVCFILITA